MTETRATLGSHSAAVCHPDGRPAMRSPSDWAGLTLQRLVIPSAAECGPQCTGVPTLFASRSGSGRRWYRSGHQVLELNTAPLIDTYSARYERDHARWQGTSGETVAVRLSPEVTRRLLHDEAHRFDLRTRYEVSDEPLKRLVFDLADEVQHGLPNGQLYADGLSLALLGWLVRHYAAAVPAPARAQTLSAVQQRRIRELIESRIGDHLPLEDLAASVSLSPYHFARLFKASFGAPPHQYLLQRRLVLAREMLRSDRDRSISDIADALGFASQPHFTDTFKRHTGTTPARWRSS